MTRAHLILGAAALVVAALMGGLVLPGLRRPAMPLFPPESVPPAPVGDTLVGPVVSTIDARSDRQWRFLSFRRGGAVDRPGPGEWDLAVRRHHLLVNGGEGFAGAGGILDLGPVRFDDVDQAPQSGFLTARARDSVVPGLEKWYKYGFTSHLLTPRGHTYVVRSADGRYAKLEILSYYCTGGTAGCLTIRYVWQGDGTRRLAAKRME